MVAAREARELEQIQAGWPAPPPLESGLQRAFVTTKVQALQAMQQHDPPPPPPPLPVAAMDPRMISVASAPSMQDAYGGCQCREDVRGFSGFHSRDDPRMQISRDRWEDMRQGYPPFEDLRAPCTSPREVARASSGYPQPQPTMTQFPHHFQLQPQQMQPSQFQPSQLQPSQFQPQQMQHAPPQQHLAVPQLPLVQPQLQLGHNRHRSPTPMDRQRFDFARSAQSPTRRVEPPGWEHEPIQQFPAPPVAWHHPAPHPFRRSLHLSPRQ